MRRDDLPLGTLVERRLVPFAGEGSGEGELAFGQIGLWQALATGVSRTVAHVARPAPGTTVDEVADMLGFMVGRHQALRTTFVLRGDGRRPRQRVATSGDLPLLVVSPGEHDPAEVAEALSAHWQTELFDYETEWPVRMAAVVADGDMDGDMDGAAVTHLVTVILHTSIDAFGFSVLAADIGARDPVTGAPAGPVTALAPLAQAAREATPAGRRQNQRSLDYLERVLRTAPAHLFGPPRHDGEPRFDILRYRSPAMSLAARAVAARERMDDSPALLAAFLVGVARVTGATSPVTIMTVSNRFRPGYAESVSALIKVVPFVLDVADLTVGEVVRRSAARSMSAYLNAYYDPDDQDEVVERVQRERGVVFDLACYYNDHRQRDRVHAGAEPPSADDIRAALADSELTWPNEVSVPRTKLYLDIDDQSGAVELTLSADARYLSRADMTALAQAIEEAAVQAALDQGRAAVERLLVPFAGEGSGEGELAFGQLGLWQSIVESGSSKTVAYVADAAPGTTVAAVADMLGFIVSRHQALRTTLLLRGEGRPPRQRVAARGEIPLRVVAAGEDGPVAVAEALSERWQTVPFAYETEWPVRMAAVVAGGAVTHVVTVILHTAIDAFGLSALVADIGARDPLTGAPAGPVTALPPLAQAAREASPAGRRQNDRSLRYLERVLRTAPARLFGPPRHDGEPRFEVVRYRSRAIAMALHAVAARERCDDSPALLTAFLVGVGRVTGVNPLATILLVSNRFRPGLADSVSSLLKVTPFVADVADRTVGDTVRLVASRSLSAFMNAYYDAYEQEERIRRIERERGEELDLSCSFNDRRQGDRVHAGVPAPGDDEIRAALAGSEFSWKQDASIPKAKLYLSIDDPPGAVELVLSADRRYFSRAEMTALALAIEEVAVQAAIEPGTPTGVGSAVAAEAAR
ncbi:condensation domain-containing protein [Actinophytocola sp. NPDC049390]|uniref:condensation domain-containing protein n=1 Tax=Actinophytocola sp. NPDC049390 TaxID=3363894 RepID=UPI00379ACC74